MIKAIYITPSIYSQFKKRLDKLIEAVPLKKKPDNLIKAQPIKSQPSKLIKFQPINSFCRNTILLPCLLGKTFNVHNGKKFIKVIVSQNIIGHKLGEFSQTRARYAFKKGKKLKQKGKK